MSFSSAAVAQAEKVETPIQSFEPEAGQGVRISPGFILHPEAIVQAQLDSNVYNVENGKTSDAIFSFQPRLALESDFSRHRVEVYGGADIRRYAKTGGENSEAADLGAKALLELGGWINTQLELKIARGVEQRGTAGDQFLTNSPIIYTRKEMLLSISRTKHRIELTLGGKITRLNYKDNFIGLLPVDLSDRDLLARDASLRLGVNLGSRVQLFTQIAGNTLSYLTPGANLRNSSGYAVLVGGKLQATNLVDLEAGVGYITQDFNNAGFKSVNAINYHLSANWTPTPNWLVTASAERAIDGSPIAEVPAIFRTSYKLEAKRTFGDRFLLGANLGVVREDYREIARVDQRYQFGLVFQYRLTNHIGLQAIADYRQQDGGLNGRSYAGEMVLIAMRIVG
jgi:hypothetical protein